MIVIDGSVGEGGGQIVRTAVSLSALTMKPVRVTKIRLGRSNPGLRRQHIAGIDLVGQLVHARVSGLDVGSKEITFKPEERGSGHYTYDVGTAGAISLVLQAVLPAASCTQEPISFTLRGGTDVPWSPPVDYMRDVFAHMLQKIGVYVEIEQKQRGHYPRGGGQVTCQIRPSSLSPIDCVYFGHLQSIRGISHCVRLPSHVASRQADSSRTILREAGLVEPYIKEEVYPKDNDPHLGPGSGIVIWAESNDGIRIGSDSIGEKGRPAEKVGEMAAMQLTEELGTGMAIDSHLCDMLVPYLAMIPGTSRVGVTKVTSHLRTIIWAVQQILGTSISLTGASERTGTLEVKGSEIGF